MCFRSHWSATPRIYTRCHQRRFWVNKMFPELLVLEAVFRITAKCAWSPAGQTDSQVKLSLSGVQLAFRLRLAMTGVEFGWAQICTQVDASELQIICRCGAKFTAVWQLRERASRLVNPFGHLRKSVWRKFWFFELALTCFDQRVRLARAKMCDDTLF